MGPIDPAHPTDDLPTIKALVEAYDAQVTSWWPSQGGGLASLVHYVEVADVEVEDRIRRLEYDATDPRHEAHQFFADRLEARHERVTAGLANAAGYLSPIYTTRQAAVSFSAAWDGWWLASRTVPGLPAARTLAASFVSDMRDVRVPREPIPLQSLQTVAASRPTETPVAYGLSLRVFDHYSRAGQMPETLEGIARGIEVPGRALSELFANRDDLLLAASWREYEDFDTMMSAAPSSPLDQLHQAIDWLERMGSDRPGAASFLLPLCARATDVRHPAHDAICAIYQRVHHFLLVQLSRLGEAGLLRDTVNPRIEAAMMLTLLIGARLHFAYRPDLVNPVEELRRYLRRALA